MCLWGGTVFLTLWQWNWCSPDKYIKLIVYVVQIYWEEMIWMVKMLLFHMGNLWVNYCHCLFLVKLFGYQVFKVPLVPSNTTTYENTWAYHLVHITSIISYSRGCCYHFRRGHYSLKHHLCEMQFKEGHQFWSSQWHLVFQAFFFFKIAHIRKQQLAGFTDMSVTWWWWGSTCVN